MWRINLVENELTLSETTASQIDALPAHFGAATRGQRLFFNRDHFEHMDYLWNKEVLDVLKRGLVNGRVLFSSSDGDNKGKTWGYEFTDGQVKHLVRVHGEWVENTGQTIEAMKATGNAPDSLANAQVGDTVAVGFIYMGLTSYETGTVGDILPDGAIIVSGNEYRAPDYRYRSDMATYVLKPMSDPNVELEE